jgi:hypothetical protein
LPPTNTSVNPTAALPHGSSAKDGTAAHASRFSILTGNFRTRNARKSLKLLIQYVKPVAIISRSRIAGRNFDRKVRYPDQHGEHAKKRPTPRRKSNILLIGARAKACKGLPGD